MTQEYVLGIFKKTGAILNGHFLLSSGLHSAQYLQCALVLQHPGYSEKLCKELAKRFKKDRPTVVIAPAIGGILVSYEVARALGARSLFTERVDGKMALRREFSLDKKDRVLVVEDVITTGLSTNEVIGVVKSYGAALVGVGSIAYRAKKNIDFGVICQSLMKIDIPAYKAEECPFCKNNIPLTKPGSRIKQ